MPIKNSSAFVLFGASGDLSRRMILPALYNLYTDDHFSSGLRIVCAVRNKDSDEAEKKHIEQALKQYLPAERFSPQGVQAFLSLCEVLDFDAQVPGRYDQLKDALGNAAQGATYFLATSPSLFGPICEGLLSVGLSKLAGGIIVEKPIGRDLASSRQVNSAVARAFQEAQVYRIDHYLGKETVQNLLALRCGNILFEPLWNAAYIEHVQITVSETVGVEGRGAYYDQAGALRDMVQNHLLQLLCLVAMEPPAQFDAEATRDEKLKVLRSLRPISGDSIRQNAVRGQYGAGVVLGVSTPAYRNDGAAPNSHTETFVALKAEIDNWRWRGVPFFLRTGKRLAERRSEIVIQFRSVPHDIFGNQPRQQKNVLRIRLQPEETVELLVMSKEPGLEGMILRPVKLNLSLTDAFRHHRRRIAYERLILDSMKGVTTLFVRRDEVEAAWSWIDRIQDAWSFSGEAPHIYPAGMWGPSASVALIERAGFSWVE